MMLIRILLGLCVVSCCSSFVAAADIEVTNNAGDASDGSFRAALAEAEPGDRIIFNFDGPGTTIVLSSDPLPTLAGDLQFVNRGVARVTIDRDATGPLIFSGGNVNLGALLFDGASQDVVLGSTTTLYGTNAITGDLTIAGTISPGETPQGNDIATLAIETDDGTIDASDATFRLQINPDNAGQANDLVDVDGTLDVTDATVNPNFIGTNYSFGDRFVVIEAGTLTGTIENETETFQLPNNPFMEAAFDGAIANELALSIRDNGLSFRTALNGCNAKVVGQVFDELRTSGSADQQATITGLRSNGRADLQRAIDEADGAIYGNLVQAELQHLHSNIASIRNRLVMHLPDVATASVWIPWVRGYGLGGVADRDDCDTVGYRQSIGGVELGTMWAHANGISLAVFGHLSDGHVRSRGIDQEADSQAYRGGVSIQYFNPRYYGFAMGGGGTQDYDVRRSFRSLGDGPDTMASFDGDAAYGYGEIGLVFAGATGLFLPHFGLQWADVSQDRFAESGGNAFSLSGDAIGADSLRSIVGFSLDSRGQSAMVPINTRLRLGWMHEYEGNAPSRTARFVDGSEQSRDFVTDAVDLDDDWLLAGLQFDVGSWFGGQISVGYEGLFNRTASLQSGMGGVAWLY